MKHIFSIPLNSEVNYYLLFYLVSFSAGFLIILYHSLKFRERLPLLFTVTAAMFLACVFGCKLMVVLENYVMASNGQAGLLQPTQMALGGATLAFLVMIVLNKVLRLPGEYLYGIGLAALVGLLVQKPGCFFGGCCKGMEATNFFGFAYADGILRHPLQLYEMVFYALAIFTLIKIKVRNIGSKYFLSLVLFCVVQFFAEFIKDPNDTLAFAQKVIGLKLIQLIYFFLSILFLSFYYLSERRKKTEPFSQPKNYALLNSTLLIIVVFVFYIIHPFLFRIEIYAVNIAFLPALFLSMIQHFNYFTLPHYRWASLLLLILPLFLMSQTLPEGTGVQKVYKTLGVGYNGGSFVNLITNDTNLDDCVSGNSREFGQKYHVMSFGYSITQNRENSQLSYGINASFGKIEETNLDTEEITDNAIISLNPYFQADYSWFGIGAGAHLGSNYYALAKSKQKESGYPETGLGSFPIYPQVHIRVGPKRFFTLEYNFANHFPAALPAFTHEMAFGSGFGAHNGLYIKYGTVFGSQAQSSSYGGYISGYIPIDNKIVVEPLIGLGSLSNVYMLGVSYRFGHKETEYTLPQSKDK